MGDNIGLRAFVRLDGQGRVVASSLIMRKKKPKVGKWMEIVKGNCCVPTVSNPFNPLAGPSSASPNVAPTEKTPAAATPKSTTTTTTTIEPMEM